MATPTVPAIPATASLELVWHRAVYSEQRLLRNKLAADLAPPFTALAARCRTEIIAQLGHWGAEIGAQAGADEADDALEEMDVLHHLAELAPAPGADDHREGAAYAALEIARDAMFPSDEARAMLTLVELGLTAGQRDAVAGQYREAAWIARELGPPDLRRRAERLAHHFGGPPSP